MRRWLSTSLLATALAFAPFGAVDANAAATKTPTVQRLDSYFSLLGGGQTITITGSGFRRATRVSFGTVGVTPTVLSDSSIRVKVPAARTVGTVDVTVTAGLATSKPVDADKFVYHDQAPDAASVTPGTFTPDGPILCMSGAGCSPIAATTSGFNHRVTCRITNSDLGPYDILWEQGANEKLGVFVTFSGKMLEITCDGVVGRTTNWPY